jgi:hypothetical protein
MTPTMADRSWMRERAAACGVDVSFNVMGSADWESFQLRSRPFKVKATAPTAPTAQTGASPPAALLLD